MNSLTLILKKTDRVVQMPAHFQSSLFKVNDTLRTVTKADLTNSLKLTTVSGAEPEKIKIVSDGGLLFYTVPWEKGASYGDVVRCYLAYVKKHFPDPEETFIIFDGYLQSSTKDMVHGIRNPIAFLEINVASTMLLIVNGSCSSRILKTSTSSSAC